jgi:hypothetical protein
VTSIASIGVKQTSGEQNIGTTDPHLTMFLTKCITRGMVHQIRIEPEFSGGPWTSKTDYYELIFRGAVFKVPKD